LRAGAARDEPGHHRPPSLVHPHRVRLQLRGLQDQPHPLAVPVGLEVVEGVELQQCRPQRAANRDGWVGAVEHSDQKFEMCVEITPRNGVLRRVVAEQRPARDPGCGRDIVDADLAEPVGGEQVQGGIGDIARGGRPPATGAGRACGCCHRPNPSHFDT